MTDSETLRAAAEVLRRRGRDDIADECEGEADAARDHYLGQVAGRAYDYTLGQNMTQHERWVAVARAVREAVEAEQ